ncbi:uncharacterized protein EI97DRAFT_239604 [Westerdykella ornata]|uniref:Uncharacterized protein n=1 Tax=Westerdykella ornata TaxID=318751 RepID=A0A6A6J6X5_WESOR|nr:uncharacterized protein EI97DRAFT_239604 [Westerdykella ornata]KAF2271903.1 hypothetical protein EI97DRAFT_239604 [Westerdykella ornata]
MGWSECMDWNGRGCFSTPRLGLQGLPLFLYVFLSFLALLFFSFCSSSETEIRFSGNVDGSLETGGLPCPCSKAQTLFSLLLFCSEDELRWQGCCYCCCCRCCFTVDRTREDTDTHIAHTDTLGR